jgi:hypothetical protein
MRKLILSSILCMTMMSSNLFAGDYVHGAGVGYELYFGTGALGGAPAFNYYGRYNFLALSDDLSIGASGNPFLGFNLSSDASVPSYFLAGITVGPALSWGTMATNDYESGFGLGFTPNYTLSFLSGGFGLNHGIGGELGIRFVIKEKPIGVHINYNKLLGGDVNQIGLKLVYFFGGN